MKENISIELYNLSEIRDWLVHNRSVRRLSELLISKTRAWAIVNNPYAEEDMNILSAIFVNDELAAYTAVFPEKMARPEQFVYWDTTLYVAPKFEGRGYAAIVIGALCEEYGDAFFDHAAAEASIANFEFLGLPVYRVPQYIFRSKHYTINTLKGKLAFCLNSLKNIERKRHKQALVSTLSNNEYKLNYVDFVDNETYSFIITHSENDIWLRTQESFNWILQYGFNRETPLTNRINKNNEFMSDKYPYGKYAVQVRSGKYLCGFYILVHNAKTLTVKYLYLEEAYSKKVFDSIVEHILKFNVEEVVTYNKNFKIYIESLKIFPALTIYQTSFTTPENFVFDHNNNLQAGDGDMIS